MVSRSTKSQIVANRRKRSRTISNGRKRSQMVANRRKSSQTIENGRKWSQTVANDHKLFKASCGYYSHNEVGILTTVEWIIASTGDAGPTFTRHWVGVGLHCLIRAAQQTRGVEPVLVLCCASVAGGGPELGQHWVNVSCLLVLTGHICVLSITGCEDVKTVAQLIEPKDDLVTVDYLPGSKS